MVGGGVAGLFAALGAAAETDVLLLAKAPADGSNSWHAQGGVAAAIGEGDEPALHAEDTLRAGRGLCRPSAVAVLTEEAPARIADLVDARRRVRRRPRPRGRPLAPPRPARRRRRDRQGDRGGARRSACASTRGSRSPRASASTAVGGGRPLRRRRSPTAARSRRRATLLATGGYAALWERTTNPPGALGEGLALAYRAGAAARRPRVRAVPPDRARRRRLAAHRGAARRGRAPRSTRRGGRFTDELAPRDVVARAIAERGQAGLDLRTIERGRFPGLMATLERAGYDPAQRADPRLAGGPLHGRRHRHRPRRPHHPARSLRRRRVRLHGGPRREPARVELAARVPRLRPPRRARRPRRRARSVPVRARPGPPRRLGPSTPEAASCALGGRGPDPQRRRARAAARLTALLPRLVAECALARRESRGGHFRSDYPTEDAAFERHVVLRRGREPVLEPWS